MAADLYIDTTSAKILSSPSSLVAKDFLLFFYGDTIPLNLNFFKQTGSQSIPLEALDFSGKQITVSVGSVNSGSLVSSTVWSDSSPFTAAISVVNSGSSSSNAQQQLNYTGSSSSGAFTLTMPPTTGTFSTSPTATVFTTASNHGLVVGQTVFLSWTGFQIPAFSNSFQNSGNYLVASIPTSTTFTVSLNGSNLSPAANLALFTDATNSTSSTVIGLSGNTFSTATAHGFSVNDVVSFAQDGIFTGVASGTNYYIQAVPSSTTFTLAATSGGAAITGISFSSLVGSWSTTALTTTTIDLSSTAAQIQSQLTSLSSIGTGNVVVSGVAPSFSITFVNALANVAIAPLVLSATSLSQHYKTGSLTLSGPALLQAVNSEASLILEISTNYNGATQTLAQCPLVIAPSLSQGASLSTSGIATGYITNPLTVGADYTFGVLPVNQGDGSPLDVTNCSLAASLYTSEGGSLIANLSVTMPSVIGNPMVCLLPASSTASFSLLSPQTWYLKLLLTRADGSVLPMGSGNVQVIP